MPLQVSSWKGAQSTDCMTFLPPSSTGEVCVTHVETPGEFYVQFVEKLAEVKHIMDNVNAHCRAPQPLKNIAVGEFL